MAYLEGLPPLPKSLSGGNLFEFNVFQQNSLSYSINIDHNNCRGENNFSRSYSGNSDNGNFVIGLRRTTPTNSTATENTVISKNRTTPPLRDGSSSLSFKQLPESSSITSARTSPIINSSKNTPHNSSRASPVIPNRGSTPPVPPVRGSIPATTNKCSVKPLTPPRPHQTINGLEISSCSLPNRPGRLFSLDTQLATLRKEMFSLRQMDLMLLNQLWSVNEAIQDFKNAQEENAALSPPSPPSCDDSDEFYSPLSTRGYQNISNITCPPFSGRLSSGSSESSIEFGDV